MFNELGVIYNRKRGKDELNFWFEIDLCLEVRFIVMVFWDKFKLFLGWI